MAASVSRSLALLAALGAGSVQARPQAQSSSSNGNSSTITAMPVSLASCPVQCSADGPGINMLSWVPISVHTTITAATVVKIINPATNSTRYSTKYATDLGGYTIPTNTNSAGTQTTQYTMRDFDTGQNTTHTMVYPTGFFQYSNYFSWQGTLPTSTEGTTRCLTYSQSTTQGLRKYPVLPAVTGTVDSQDPRGYHYTIDGFDGDFFGFVPTSDFPGIAALSSCSTPPKSAVAPEADASTALLLTATSTSIESVAPTASAPSAHTPTAQPNPMPSAPVQTSQPVGVSPSTQTAPAAPPPAVPSNPAPANPAPANPAPANPAPANPNPANPNPANPNPANPNPANPNPANPAPAQPAAPTSTPRVVVIGSSTLTADSSGNLNVGGQTLAPGGAPITVGGTQLSFATQGSAVIAGSGPGAQTLPVAPGPAAPPTAPGPAVAAVPQFNVGGQKLVAGGPAITVSGTQISLAPGASYAVIGSSTEMLQGGAATGAPAITIGSVTYHAEPSAAGYVIGGQTLTPGAVTTVSGTRVSLASGGSYFVYGSSTEMLGETGSGMAAATTPAAGATGASGPMATIYTGAAAKSRGFNVFWAALPMVLLVLV